MIEITNSDIQTRYALVRQKERNVILRTPANMDGDISANMYDVKHARRG